MSYGLNVTMLQQKCKGQAAGMRDSAAGSGVEAKALR